MNAQSKKYDLELLNKLESVEAPASIWFAIQNRLSSAREVNFSRPVAWAIRIAAVLVLALNVWVWTSKSHSSKAENLADTFQLVTSSNLYE